MTETDLVFNMVEQTLTGCIDGTYIDARAVSGGRAGSKTEGAVNYFVANNPFATGIKKNSKHAGGPLPLGKYRLKTHETRADWVRLEPFGGTAMKGRDGMAIHGRGKRGSDGCIVPTDFHNVTLIYSLVKAREDGGKPAPTLEVVAIGDLDRFLGLKNWA